MTDELTDETAQIIAAIQQKNKDLQFLANAILSMSERIDDLEQKISDVNDANLYGYAQLEERIEKMWRKLNHKGGEDG